MPWSTSGCSNSSGSCSSSFMNCSFSTRINHHARWRGTGRGRWTGRGPWPWTASTGPWWTATVGRRHAIAGAGEVTAAALRGTTAYSEGTGALRAQRQTRCARRQRRSAMQAAGARGGATEVVQRTERAAEGVKGHRGIVATARSSEGASPRRHSGEGGDRRWRRQRLVRARVSRSCETRRGRVRKTAQRGAGGAL